MMGFDRWRMNCSINCESRFGTWEEMLRFLGRKDHGSWLGDVDPQEFHNIKHGFPGSHHFQVPFMKIWRCFCWCFWWGQVFVWELDQQSGMSWESLEGFLDLEMVSVPLWTLFAWLSWRQERLRAQAEQRVREQGSSGEETERVIGAGTLLSLPGSGRRKHIQKAKATNHKPAFCLQSFFCIFFLIFKVKKQGFVSREMCQFNIFFCCPRMFERFVSWLGS